MKSFFILNSIVSFALLSVLCVPFTEPRRKPVVISGAASDSTPKFVVDDYPVTNKMLEAGYARIKGKMQSGEIHSSDKLWYGNDSLKEVLVLETYTDYYRNIIFHFKANDIPKDLIRRMELGTENFDTAAQSQKEKYFPGFRKMAFQLPHKYFRSKKGFRLGDTKQKVLAINGKPDKIVTRDGVEKYEWDYIGDVFYDPEKDKGKKIAFDSYGHQTFMFFRKNELIAIILHNDIP
jgi:hypothetical protein